MLMFIHSCYLLFDQFQFTLIHVPNIRGSYAILFFTASEFAFTTKHIQRWVLFSLWLSLFITSGAISPLFSSSTLSIYWPEEFTFQCHIFLPFIWFMGSQSKNDGMVCHSLLQWTTFCQNFPPWPIHLGWPYLAWLSFIELDKVVVRVTDWLVVCECGFSLSALWCPLSAPTTLLGFLLPWTWVISSLLLQQSTVAAPYLGSRVAPLDCHP